MSRNAFCLFQVVQQQDTVKTVYTINSVSIQAHYHPTCQAHPNPNLLCMTVLLIHVWSHPMKKNAMQKPVFPLLRTFSIAAVKWLHQIEARIWITDCKSILTLHFLHRNRFHSSHMCSPHSALMGSNLGPVDDQDLELRLGVHPSWKCLVSFSYYVVPGQCWWSWSLVTTIMPNTMTKNQNFYGLIVFWVKCLVLLMSFYLFLS